MKTDEPGALYQKGLFALSLNNPESALDSFARAAELGEDSPEFNHDYALALANGWEYETASKYLSRAIELKPDFTQALNNHGNVFHALGKYEQALEMYLRAEKLAPNSSEIAINTGMLLEKLEQYTKALRRYERVVKGYPGLATGHFYLARALLATGQPAKALVSANRSLQKNPHLQEAIALKAALLSELGRTDASRRLVDHERFIRTFHMPVPDGYENIAEFHKDLIRHLDAPETKKFDPFLTATSNGVHTRNILDDPAKPVLALKQGLQDMFRRYVEDLPVDPDHPFLRQAFSPCRISAEAQLLNSSGFQDTHLHDAAKVSGAYYVSLPQAVKSGKDRAGWLEFGHLPDEIKNSTKPDILPVQPHEGMAALFPSYFYHGTRPFVSNERRISLGIDLITLSA